MDLFIDANGVIRQGRLVKIVCDDDGAPNRAESFQDPDSPRSECASESGFRSGVRSFARMLSLPFSTRSSRVSDHRDSSNGQGMGQKKASWRKLLLLPSRGLKKVPEEKELQVEGHLRADRWQKESTPRQSGWRSKLYGSRPKEEFCAESEAEAAPAPSPFSQAEGQHKFLFDSNGVPLFEEKKTGRGSKGRRKGMARPCVHDVDSDHSSSASVASAPVSSSRRHLRKQGEAHKHLAAFKGTTISKEGGKEGGKKAGGGRRKRDHRKSFSDGYISFDEHDKAREAQNWGALRIEIPTLPKAHPQDAFFLEYQRKAAAAAALEDFSLPTPPAVPWDECQLAQTRPLSPLVTPNRRLNAPFRTPVSKSGVLQPKPDFERDGESSQGEKGGKQRRGEGGSRMKRGERVTTGGRRRKTHRRSMSDGELSPSERGRVLREEQFPPLSRQRKEHTPVINLAAIDQEKGPKPPILLSPQAEHTFFIAAHKPVTPGYDSSREDTADVAASSLSKPAVAQNSSADREQKSSALPGGGRSPLSPRSPLLLHYSSHGESVSSRGVSEDLAGMPSPKGGRVQWVVEEATEVQTPAQETSACEVGAAAAEASGRLDEARAGGGAGEADTMASDRSADRREPAGEAQEEQLRGTRHRRNVSDVPVVTGGSQSGLRRRRAGSLRGQDSIREDWEVPRVRPAGGVRRKEEGPPRDQKRKQLMQELKKWEWKEQCSNYGAGYEIQEKPW